MAIAATKVSHTLPSHSGHGNAIINDCQRKITPNQTAARRAQCQWQMEQLGRLSRRKTQIGSWRANIPMRWAGAIEACPGRRHGGVHLCIAKPSALAPRSLQSFDAGKFGDAGVLIVRKMVNSKLVCNPPNGGPHYHQTESRWICFLLSQKHPALPLALYAWFSQAQTSGSASAMQS